MVGRGGGDRNDKRLNKACALNVAALYRGQLEEMEHSIEKPTLSLRDQTSALFVQNRWQAQRSIPTSRLPITNPNTYSCLLLVRVCGDVVQLDRTLPRRWLESHTVTAAWRYH
jgi:gamma-glutamyl:cysteine ligase YbdK (ATP-grasp superfamily)